ncbi:unnamed protein product [Linum trigynum]|uniref:Uncharacterized protein n=1 Tax=Linum trigynum TaxID=586398 RepID=A0AAV2D1M1_9ROSI
MGANNSKAAGYGANAAKRHEDDEPQKQNKVEDADLYYVTPASIGVGNIYDRMTKLIPRNTAIPTTQKFETVFSTSYDNQQVVNLKVYLGERSKASQNKLLAQLEFPNLPAAPKGVEKVTLSLDIDARGALNVRIEHQATGRNLKLVVEGVGVKGKLMVTDEEVEKMVREGEEHKLEDEEYAGRAVAASAMLYYACAMTTRGDHQTIEGSEGSTKLVSVADRTKVNDILNNVVAKMLDEFKEKVKELER